MKKALLIFSLAVIFLVVVKFSIRIFSKPENNNAIIVNEEGEFSEIGLVPDFELLNQYSEKVASKELRGRVWVANFLYTRCVGPCPKQAEIFKYLQSKLPKDVLLVSISLDPEYDSSEIIEHFAQKYEAQKNKWHILTGDKKVIDNLTKNVFKITVQKDEKSPPSQWITHSTYFFLVDKKLRIRKFYHSDSLDFLELTRDVIKLLKEQE